MQQLPADIFEEIIIRLERPGDMMLTCKAAFVAAAASDRCRSVLMHRCAVRRFGADGAVYHACTKRDQEDMLRAVMAHERNLARHLEYCFFRAIEEGTCTPSIAEMLIRGGADPNSDIRPLLHLACAKSGIDTIRVMIDSGADVSRRDQYDMQPHDVAVHLGRTEVADLIQARRS